MTAPLLLVTALLAAPGSGTTPGSEVFEAFHGSYSPIAPKKQRKALNGKIDKGVAHLNFLIRWKAAEVIRYKTRIPSRLTIRSNGDRVLLMTPLRRPWWTGLDGKQVKIHTRDKRTAKLGRQLDGNVIVERFSTGKGSRTHRFILRSNGKLLDWEVILSSPRLQRPIRYTMRYRRQ